MNIIITIGIGAAALIILILLLGRYATGGSKTVLAENLKQFMKENPDFKYIDVRTKQEYKSGNIRRFQNIPLDKIEEKLNKLDKEQTYVLLCQSGARSRLAVKNFKKAGFKNVYNVIGGYKRYNKK